MSLGHLSRVLISSYSVDTDTDMDVIQSIGETFSRVLTQCRHRVSPPESNISNLLFAALIKYNASPDIVYVAVLDSYNVW